jgi:hypothetical protein
MVKGSGRGAYFMVLPWRTFYRFIIMMAKYSVPVSTGMLIIQTHILPWHLEILCGTFRSNWLRPSALQFLPITNSILHSTYNYALECLVNPHNR